MRTKRRACSRYQRADGLTAQEGRDLPFLARIRHNPERPFKLSSTRSGRRRRHPHHGNDRVRPRQDRRADRRGRGGARAQAQGEHRVPRDRQPPRRGRCRLELAGLAAPRDLHRSRQGVPDLGHRRQRVHRFPPRLRRDGGGAREPDDRRGDQARGRPRHALRAADEGPRRDRAEPHRPFQTAAVAVRELGHRGDARGAPPDARGHRARHDHQDRGLLSRSPRLDHVQRRARPLRDRSARAPGHRAAGDGHPAGVRRPRARRAVQRPRRGQARVRREPGQDRRHDRRAGDDELRRDPAGARLPAGPEGSVSRERRIPRLRRGEDRRDPGVRRRGRVLRRRVPT